MFKDSFTSTHVTKQVNRWSLFGYESARTMAHKQARALLMATSFPGSALGRERTLGTTLLLMVLRSDVNDDRYISHVGMTSRHVRMSANSGIGAQSPRGCEGPIKFL